MGCGNGAKNNKDITLPRRALEVTEANSSIAEQED